MEIINTKLPNGGMLKKFANGSRLYYLNDKLHREDGPAMEFENGDKYYCINGQYHREDGPAIQYKNGGKYWFLNGMQVQCKTQNEFRRFMKLKVFW